MEKKEQTKVLFVCLGNICRSPAAEGMMRDLIRAKGATDRYVLDSAGTIAAHAGDGPDRRMRVHARQRGIELDHVSRRITTEDFRDFDVIIGMDAANLADLRRMAPSVEDARKIHAMAEFFPRGCRYDHVPDPYYEGAEGFELVLDLLGDASENLFSWLEKQ